MFSPKMQRPIRINESQLLILAERARYDATIAGFLYKRTSDGSKWQLRWFTLYQNLLIYSEMESSSRPSGVIFLEGSYCDRVIVSGNKNKQIIEKQYCFAITFRRDSQRSYELRAESESDCKAWIQAIKHASFNKLLLQKEELEQKHLHLLQIVESEKTAKWQYTQQCEELTDEIKQLRSEVPASRHRKGGQDPATTAIANFTVADNANPPPSCSANATIRIQLCALKKEWRLTPSGRDGKSGQEDTGGAIGEESEDLKKIRKVQGFFRGWLCRHRWKMIVEEYIKSPHAESMRKRNSLVFRMLEDEEENVAQLEILVARFYRPFKMAASSKKPPCTHEDVSSIFLNCETILFLHQIFYKGLQARMNSWPTLVLGDLFDVLLPMLNIYQEYVRSHHFSLQILTECKQNAQFAQVLARLENHSVCKGRSLETFLTYPMHQIPRYIITLHEILAHTPYEHVERRSLENARVQLETLSRQMHDEVSETENIRKCLAIERMIVEGCDILMDVTQVFVRQGTLLHIIREKRSHRGRLSISNRGERSEVRQCFLFSNNLIIATRTSDGKLHLLSEIGKIPLVDASLIEDPNESSSNDEDEADSACSASSHSSEMSESSVAQVNLNCAVNRPSYLGLDFQLIVENKAGGPAKVVHLVAPSMQDKTAWISDISQCIDNVHFNDFVHSSISDASSVTHPHSVRNDPRLFNDDIDIRFSRTLNSCKVPQIRYATPERLLERLTDLRFLSIDFLNTFLLTYRVFTDGVTVLDALKKVFYAGSEILGAGQEALNCSNTRNLSISSIEFGQSCHLEKDSTSGYGSFLPPGHSSYATDGERRKCISPRRISHGSAVSGSPKASPRNSPFTSPRGSNQWCRPSEAALPSSRRGSRFDGVDIPEATEEDQPATKSTKTSGRQHLTIPKGIESSSSAETLTEGNGGSSTSTLVALSTSTHTLTAFTIGSGEATVSKDAGDALGSSAQQLPSSPPQVTQGQAANPPQESCDIKVPAPHKATDSAETATVKAPVEPAPHPPNPPHPPVITRRESMIIGPPATSAGSQWLEVEGSDLDGKILDEREETDHRMTCNPMSSVRRSSRNRPGEGTPPMTSSTRHSTSCSFESPVRVGAGVVVTSHRQSQRRSSTSSAAAAFAAATAGSSNPRDYSLPPRTGSSRSQTYAHISSNASNASGDNRPPEGLTPYRKESIMSTAATMRVLSVLRHWISKHREDFDSDARLKNLTIEFLDDVLSSPQLLPAEHKAASQLLQLLTREDPLQIKLDLHVILASPLVSSRENIETLSALEIAEQMTVLDHAILVSIKSEELLCQAWMKPDKNVRAPHIVLITKRFNEVSRLVASEIIRRQNLTARVAVIEKWAAVADICRCMHNFNGVLQICSAFTNSAVFRLKKTWEKLSKTTRQTIDKLQNIVSTDGRFRNLRDALHRCDPPCIPYLGMYLTDLSFIEEGTPDFTEDGLLNFSKMRMVAHVIREIRHFQSSPYKIEHSAKVNNYLLEPSILLDDEELYQMSLEIEPRQLRLGSISQQVGSCLATMPSASNISPTQ